MPPAISFWISLLFIPLFAAALVWGGWWIAALPIFGWYGISLLDAIAGVNTANPDPDAPAPLFWYRALTWVWVPLQLGMILAGLLAFATGHVAGWHAVGLFAALGVVTGTIGINYAHELIHQSPRFERLLGDVLLISVLYGHFRTEHILVHHRYVATPRDAVTARYNEGFHKFALRVLPSGFQSAWSVEADRQRLRNQPVWHRSNPFWLYLGGALFVLSLAWVLAGWAGVGLYLLQAFVAVITLELVNYIEHYGLTREYLGNGRFENVKPRHSWNAAHRVSNYLLINLQRHSDHHYKPARRFPLLQTYPESEAPQLPLGYPLMGMLALVPPLWRRVMNPRVRLWRQQFYPHISDWTPYKNGQHEG